MTYSARFTAMILAAASLLLASCGTDSGPKGIPRDMNFKRYQPITINVGKIDIFEEYRSPMRDPYVEHLMPITPTEAMRKWVEDRLRVGGMDKSLQVIIKDASVVATALPKPAGIQGIVNMGNDRRYDAKLVVEMRIYGEGAMSEASIEVSATQMITISESASLTEREALFRRMIFDLMETMNATLEKNIYQYFGNQIVY